MPTFLPGHAPSSLGYKALKSLNGGKVKAPTGLFGRAGAGIAKTGRSVAGAVKIKPLATTKTTVPKVGTSAVSAPAGPQDPNEFIKNLLISTDPTAVRNLIDQVYAPSRQAINDQIAQLQASSQARAGQMQQVYQAFAQYMGGLPQQMADIYKGQGYADGAALAQGMAGPGGNVGAHLQSLSNADMMSQLSANWQSWAKAQPGIYSLMATSNIKQMLNAEGDSEAQLRSKLLDLSSQEASSILNYITQAQSKDASLQEWAYQQGVAQTNARASQNQAYLNYLQRQSQVEFEQLMATKKFTEQQAVDKVNADYKAQLAAARQQGLIDTETYHSQLVSQGAQRIATGQKNAATARMRAQQAMQ